MRVDCPACGYGFMQRVRGACPRCGAQLIMPGDRWVVDPERVQFVWARDPDRWQRVGA